MIKVRLARGGTKNKPFFRIVAIDSRRKRGGKPLDILGFWQPAKDDIRGKRTSEGQKSIDRKKVKFWKSRGAQVTAAVNRLIANK